MAKQEEPRDLIRRGDLSSNPAGVLTFCALRPLDTLLQYHLLAGSGGALLAKAGISTIAAGSAFQPGIAVIDRLKLPLPHLVLLAMSAGATLKQIYWLVGLSRENFGAGAAVGVTLFNTVVNTANTMFFLASATSAANGPSFPGVSSLSAYQVVGAAVYVLGILLETCSEYQRKAFKDDPANKGKVMRTGLWSLARHINYGGYVLWRGGYALAAWGLPGLVLMAGFQAHDFATRGVPVLDEYCSKRYGEQWASFKRDVKWVLIPGVY
ncbi:hypothetical protein S7711_08544 [Stachybotrys chartarum IBT 7711]|uniref:Uncharacterized protein n=1 Tax=Stachybotrys chartarum (strain CBS 109288 / IBT 7711) TaxID=1280523 RepID=A0A084B1B9_STACB|nr:hypothetical protein S7711_08544 [Stachybotrys chartarum IBT 7711]